MRVLLSHRKSQGGLASAAAALLLAGLGGGTPAAGEESVQPAAPPVSPSPTAPLLDSGKDLTSAPDPSRTKDDGPSTIGNKVPSGAQPTTGSPLQVHESGNTAMMRLPTPRPGEVAIVYAMVRSTEQPRISIPGGAPREAITGITVLGGSEPIGVDQDGRKRYAVTVPVLKPKKQGSRSVTGSLRVRVSGANLQVDSARVFERAFSRRVSSEMCRHVEPLDLRLRHPKDRVDIEKRKLFGRMPRGFTDPDYLGGFAVQRACGVPGPESYLTLMRGKSDKRVSANGASAVTKTELPPLPAINRGRDTTDAILLVSGFISETPFMTPDCDASQAGDTWEKAFGYLKEAGYPVFAMAADTSRQACTDETDMPAGLDTKGDLDINGERFARFLNWMSDSYGVRRVWLIGHSDGGMWSRAAMDFKSSMPSLTFPLITTLDTPHLGSMMADVGLAAARQTQPLYTCLDHTCILRNALAPLVDALEGLIFPGAALEELTGAYTRRWNYRERGVLTAEPQTPIYTLSGDGFTNNLYQLLGNEWELDTRDGRYWYANDLAVGVSSQQGDTLQADGIATVRCFPTQDDLHTETVDTSDLADGLDAIGELLGDDGAGDAVPGLMAITGDPQTMENLDSALAGNRLPDDSCPHQTAGDDTTLPSGASLAPGESIDDPVYGMHLQMRADGDLVLTGSDGWTWWRSGTAGHPGATAQMGVDGNFGVYDQEGRPLWVTDTSGHFGATMQVRREGFGVYGKDNTEYFTSVRRCTGTDKPSTIEPGTRLYTGHSLCSSDHRYMLSMLPNGNLALYDQGNDSRRLWVSGTYGNKGVYAEFQSDGNFVLYDQYGRAVWASDTWRHPGGTLSVSSKKFEIKDAGGASVWRSDRCPSNSEHSKPGTTLKAGQRLEPGQSLCSGNGNYRLTMQTDGDLTFYDVKGGAGEYWSSKTYGNPGAYAQMGDDGNFVIYTREGKPLWATGTWNSPGAFVLVTEESKKFVVKLPNKDIWNSIKGALT